MTERNQGLDGLRGVAATAVIFFHCLGAHMQVPQFVNATSPYDVAARIALAVFNGETAVFVFFIMSGAVLMNSLQRQSGPFAALAAKFVCERFFRLFPALAVAVLLCFEVMVAVGDHPTTEQLIKNLTLYDNPINGATWTLNAEAIGTFFILAGFIAHRRFGLIGLLVVLAVVAIASRHLQPKDFLYFFRWSVMPFAIGMLIPTPAGRAITLRLSWPTVWASALIAIFGRHITNSHGTTAANISIICAGVVVAALFYNKAGELGRILSARPLVFLGTISYSLYLLNVTFVILADKLLGHPQSLLLAIAEGAAITLLTIPAAWASYKWIEEPCIRVGRHAISSARSLPD